MDELGIRSLVVALKSGAAVAKTLRAQLSSWSSDIFLIQDWYREA